MKKLLFLAAFISCAGGISTAASATQSATQSENDKTCSRIYDIAKTTMGARQMGVPMPTMIKTANNNPYVRKIVIAAYDKPKFSSQSYIDNEVSEFADFWYSDCVKTLSK